MFELNDQQRRAVIHRGGPLLVAAGAGTGKTGSLASRVADLIASGVEPGRICLLTFTRRAAQEMLARAGDLTTPAAAAQVCGGTFMPSPIESSGCTAGGSGWVPISASWTRPTRPRCWAWSATTCWRGAT